MLEVSENKYFKLDEVMEGLGWSESTLYERMRTGLPYVRVGTKRAIRGGDLIKYMAEHTVVERSA